MGETCSQPSYRMKPMGRCRSQRGGSCRRRRRGSWGRSVVRLSVTDIDSLCGWRGIGRRNSKYPEWGSILVSSVVGTSVGTGWAMILFYIVFVFSFSFGLVLVGVQPHWPCTNHHQQPPLSITFQPSTHDSPTLFVVGHVVHHGSGSTTTDVEDYQQGPASSSSAGSSFASSYCAIALVIIIAGTNSWQCPARVLC